MDLLYHYCTVLSLSLSRPPSPPPPPSPPCFTRNSHNLALLLLKSGPGAEQSPSSARATGESYDDKWQWERVKGSASDQAGGGAAGNGVANGVGDESFRWRHTEAVELLERALAVHREVRFVFVFWCGLGWASARALAVPRSCEMSWWDWMCMCPTNYGNDADQCAG